MPRRGKDVKEGVGEARRRVDIYTCLIRREGKGTVITKRMKNTHNLRLTRTKMESLQIEPTSKTTNMKLEVIKSSIFAITECYHLSLLSAFPF